jgi:hypothetical protein
VLQLVVYFLQITIPTTNEPSNALLFATIYYPDDTKWLAEELASQLVENYLDFQQNCWLYNLKNSRAINQIGLALYVQLEK